MLAHLKIIWQFHAHAVHQKVSRFFGARSTTMMSVWGCYIFRTIKVLIELSPFSTTMMFVWGCYIFRTIKVLIELSPFSTTMMFVWGCYIFRTIKVLIENI
jgi:hypothetical protein